jgi:hypothetical protein
MSVRTFCHSLVAIPVMKLPVGYVGNGVVYQATAFGGLGQKLLEKHGWEKGQGLGKEKRGISKAIEVQKREDQLGVSALRGCDGGERRASCDVLHSLIGWS